MNIEDILRNQDPFANGNSKKRGEGFTRNKTRSSRARKRRMKQHHKRKRKAARRGGGR
jgi:hypothetical protein